MTRNYDKAIRGLGGRGWARDPSERFSRLQRTTATFRVIKNERRFSDVKTQL